PSHDGGGGNAVPSQDGGGGNAGGSSSAGGGGGQQQFPLDHPPPRLIGPLSGSLASTAQPQLRWELAAGTHRAAVDVCRDRACQNIIVTLTATGTGASPPAPLPAGHVFWRARGAVAGAAGTTASPVWELFIPHRVSTPSTALATWAD